MSEENNIILPETNAIQNKSFDDSVIDDVTRAGDYLPRLQLFSSKAAQVAEGKIGPNRYGVVNNSKDVPIDLGSEIELLPVAWRPKAMDISGDNIINVHNNQNAEFKRIVAQSEVKDSGCMYGIEFAVWVPKLEKFCSMFFNSKTMRRAAPGMFENKDGQRLMGYPRTLRVELIRKGPHVWAGPIITPCVTPIEMPDPMEVKEVVEKFLNVAEVETETVDETRER